MVFAECFKTYFKGKSKEETPLFNLLIKLEGWRGPFKDFNSFLYIAELARFNSHLEGKCYVMPNGEIKKGSVGGLHTFEAYIDLYAKNHIHYGKRGRVLPLQNPVTIDPKDLPKSPKYTLNGLYEVYSAKGMCMGLDTKIAILSHKINPESEMFNSIAKRKITKLKLLENAYRREISDQ